MEENLLFPENSEPSQNADSVQPLVSTSVELNEELYSRMTKKLRVGSVLFIVLGAVGLLYYIVGEVLYGLSEDSINSGGSYWTARDFFLWIAAFVFVLGLILFFGTRSSAGKIPKCAQMNYYEFYGHHVLISSSKDGEIIATAKCYYPDFFRVKETRELILMYQTSAAVYAVDKKKLTEEDLIEVRRLLNLPVRKK